MKCPSCGTGLDQNARFCGVCGHRLAVPGPPAAGVSVAAARAAPVPSDPYIGTVLNNRFEIQSKLGEGGFGAVYKGVQKSTGRIVALKLLHPEMTRDANLLERFRREGLVLCNLSDAHTITTYDFDQTPDGTLYIAMELLEGRSLHDVFHDEAPIEWRRMLKIVSAMCSSLAEAHAQGIVHRDLKPENIHLELRPGNPEFVKILDFGIAKVMRGDGISNQSPQLTATGQTLGTLEYMSPEQLMGKQLDGRSDVYAIGVVTYELITGRLPFPDAKGPAQLITAQLKQTPLAPSQANPAGNIPPGIDACIARMLEKDKNNRFADVAALRIEVDRLLAAGGQLAAGSAPQAISQAPVPAHNSAPAPAPQPYHPPPVQPMGRPSTHPMGPSTARAVAAARGSRLWLWLALGIVALGGAVGAIIALS
ncbi:MAG TPA: serine/threonine-protein kinase [Kofleriaceae bacterium]|nr:serine/threonine-protein kinase [Kofleriaceae bacterium]